MLVPFGLFGRTAFLAEKVLGNVVSSGVKILVLAVIVGIGSTIFGQFTSGFNNPPTISDALTLILAALSLLGLSIFGPGIANGLIAGGPQLGAGAAVGTGLAVAGMGAAGAGARGRGTWAPPVAPSPEPRALAPASRAAPAPPIALAVSPASPRPARPPPSVRCAAPPPACVKASRPGAGPRPGGAGPSGAGAAGPAEASGPPAWARQMKRNQTISHGASAAEHAIRSGDRPSGGGGVDLSEGE